MFNKPSINIDASTWNSTHQTLIYSNNILLERIVFLGRFKSIDHSFIFHDVCLNKTASGYLAEVNCIRRARWPSGEEGTRWRRVKEMLGLSTTGVLGSQFLLLQDTVLKVPSEGDISKNKPKIITVCAAFLAWCSIYITLTLQSCKHSLAITNLKDFKDLKFCELASAGLLKPSAFRTLVVSANE